jgi:hypothetical protein
MAGRSTLKQGERQYRSKDVRLGRERGNRNRNRIKKRISCANKAHEPRSRLTQPNSGFIGCPRVLMMIFSHQPATAIPLESSAETIRDYPISLRVLSREWNKCAQGQSHFEKRAHQKTAP